jgi:hypothetical protein
VQALVYSESEYSFVLLTLLAPAVDILLCSCPLQISPAQPTAYKLLPHLRMVVAGNEEVDVPGREPEEAASISVRGTQTAARDPCR